MLLKRQLGLVTATFVVIASMIGTGIFMTTGHVLGMTGSAMAVMILWTAGGFIAVCGSLCFAELAATWPEAGGEYIYLKKSFGFLPAFLTGWISLVVAFSAPAATAAMLLVRYVNHFLHTALGTAPAAGILDGTGAQKCAAAVIIIFFGCLHIVGIKRGSAVQNALTVLKLLIMVVLIGIGFCALDLSTLARLNAHYPAPGRGDIGSLGLGLLVIMFAYSGWNGASYMGSEIRSPAKNLPRAMFWGTIVTTVLYLLLNIIFLLAAPGQEIINRDEIAAIAAGFLFGPAVNGVLFLGIALILLSTVSVYLMMGPRVCYAMACDRMLFARIAEVHPRFGTPWMAVLIQTALAVIYILAGTAMELVIYMGFALNIFPVLAVIGLMRMRRKEPALHRPYRVPLYPLIPLLYVGASITMLIAALLHWTVTSLVSIAVLAAGVPVFYLWRRLAGHA